MAPQPDAALVPFITGHSSLNGDDWCQEALTNGLTSFCAKAPTDAQAANNTASSMFFLIIFSMFLCVYSFLQMQK